MAEQTSESPSDDSKSAGGSKNVPTKQEKIEKWKQEKIQKNTKNRESAI